MFARDEQEIAETLIFQRLRFALDFLHAQRDAQNRVVAREAAILAVVDALVGEIQRREKANHLAETLQRQAMSPPAHRLQQPAAGRRNQRGKIRERHLRFPDDRLHGFGPGVEGLPHQRGDRQRIEFSDKTHPPNVTKVRAKSRQGVIKAGEEEERGCVEDQPQHVRYTHRSACFTRPAMRACCDWPLGQSRAP